MVVCQIATPSSGTPTYALPVLTLLGRIENQRTPGIGIYRENHHFLGICVMVQSQPQLHLVKEVGLATRGMAHN